MLTRADKAGPRPSPLAGVRPRSPGCAAPSPAAAALPAGAPVQARILLKHLRSGSSAEAQRALLQLQRQYGNQHVRRVLKLARPDDKDEEQLQAKREDRDEDEVAPAVEAAINRKRGGGQALDSGARTQMGAAFGADFSSVRVHTDSEADTLNRALGARAFTTGRDVFFRQGEYNPGGSSGRELLAHELTHVVQQGGDAIRAKMTVSQPDDPHEVEADEMARQVVRQESRDRPSADAKSTEVIDDVGPLDEKRPLSPVSDARSAGSMSVHRALTVAETAENLRSAKYAGNPQLESAFDNAPVLRRGTKGDGVKLVQEGLVADGFAMPISTKPDGQMDGDFGGETASAVMKFQTKHALSPDSRVGRDTMRKLDELAGGAGPTPPGPVPVPPGPGPVPTPPPPLPVVPLAVIIGKVRAPSTPAAMTADRVPPRVDTAVSVTVSGFSPPMAPVTLAVEGAGGGNGTATLNGAATADLTADAVVQVRGGAQTAPGNGGKLRLVARQGTGPQLATSNLFSVSSIPQNYSDTFVSLVTGSVRGIVVQDGWESDSGTFTDLNETEISERVEHKSSSGCLAGFGSGNSGYLPGNVLTTDTHSTRTSSLTGDGNVFTHQTCMFKDHRTGAADIPMTASGFHLTRNVVAPVPPAGGPIRITTSKVGGGATAKGISSGAGTANIVKQQDV